MEGSIIPASKVRYQVRKSRRFGVTAGLWERWKTRDGVYVGHSYHRSWEQALEACRGR